MFCEVTALRLRGGRLPESKWPNPVRGHLVIGPTDERQNQFLRGMVAATIFSGSGSNWQTIAYLADVRVTQTLGDGFMLSGFEIVSDEGAVSEHRQLWLCRPTSPNAGALPRIDIKAALEKPLPM